MDPLEIETLIVRMAGDVGDLEADFQTVTDQLDDIEEQAEETADAVEGLTDRMGGMADALTNTLAAIGLGGILHEAFGEWTTAEHTAIRLSAAIRANGHEVQSTLEDYQEFAAAIQQTTTLGDDAVLMMLRTAETLGLTGDAAKEATRAAIGLGEAASIPAEAALRVTAAVEKGDVKTAMLFSRMIRPLRGVRNEAEFLATYANLVAGGLETAGEIAETAAGKMEQLKNDFGDFLEEIGKIIAEGILPFVQGLKEAVRWLQAMPQPMKIALVAVLAMVAAFAALTAAITLAGTVFNSLFGGAGIILGAIVAAGAGIGVIVHQLGGMVGLWDKIRNAANKAWEWLKPIRQAVMSFFKSLMTVAEEVWGYIQDRALEVWDAITQAAKDLGIDIKIDWEKIRDTIVDAILTAEFMMLNFNRVSELGWKRIQLATISWWEDLKHILTVLPGMIKKALSGEGFEIPGRVMTKAEEELAKEVAKLGGELGQELDKFLKERKNAFAKEGDDPVSNRFKKNQKDIEKATKELKNFDAALKGSSEAASRIMAQREQFARTDGGSRAEGNFFDPGRGGARMQPGPRSAPVVFQGSKVQEQLLREIRDTLRFEAKKPKVEVEPANL